MGTSRRRVVTFTRTLNTKMASMIMSAACAQPLAARKFQGSRVSGKSVVRAARASLRVNAKADGPVIIGLAADSGCGKSTFMRRMTSLFGGKASPPEGGNPDSNTLISDTTTVLCLDDYHLNDRQGRKESGLTALNLKEQNFDLMCEQVKALKEGKTVQKPIYNHVTGVFDPAEEIVSPKILILEGLHPFADDRVRDFYDFKIYLDISDDVKFAWKIQRDMAERGHSLESIKASIEARKPDFDAFVDPQKKFADVVIQVLPTQLIPDDNEGKILRVRMIMKEGVKFFYGPDTFYGEEVSVLEMDGQFDKLEELI